MKDLHLPLVNRYDVKTLHPSQLNTVVTIDGPSIWQKSKTAAFHSNTGAFHPKMVLFENMS